MGDESSHARQLTDRQRFAWLRLIRSENVGPITFRNLVNQFGGAEEALEALPGLARRGGRAKPIRICSRGEAERELAKAHKIGARLVARREHGYPPLLLHIDASPPLLYIQGQAALAMRPAIAIVGSRNASAAGRKIARDLARELSAAGYVIVSGLARGIDTAAHQAALDHATIAVLAGGVDCFYPPENADLQRAIAKTGLLVSELPPGLEPRGRDFPRRNRLISGAAHGVVVVEAARRSGSLITARRALDQGRDVLAVPGHPLDPRAAGTNMLIKEGAPLVADARDVLDHFGHFSAQLNMAAFNDSLDAGQGDRGAAPSRSREDWPDGAGPYHEPEPDVRKTLLEALGPAPIEIDEIARTTGISIRDVRVALLELDLAGRIAHHAGQRVSLSIDET